MLNCRSIESLDSLSRRNSNDFLINSSGITLPFSVRSRSFPYLYFLPILVFKEVEMFLNNVFRI
jgi:hypothetical protein